jgi:hypothetical protein
MVGMDPARRIARIENPSVTMPIRHPDGRLDTVDLWRGDLLVDLHQEGTGWLIVDLGYPEFHIPGTDNYSRPGSIVVLMQRIDLASGEGLSTPTEHVFEFDSTRPMFDPDTDGERSQTGGVAADVTPLTGVKHLPVSERRLNA